MTPLPTAGQTRVPHRTMSAQDSLWLDLDRPENRMAIVSALWTATPVDPERLREVIVERLLGRHPIYSQHPVRAAGLWRSAVWRTDSDFDLDRHFSVGKLPEPGTRELLQDFVAAERGHAFDLRHPLWSVQLLQGYGQGSALVLRSHHAMADGVRLAQVMFSLFDPIGAEPAILSEAGGAEPARARPARVSSAGSRLVRDAGAKLQATAVRAGAFAEAAVAFPLLGAAAIGNAADFAASVLPSGAREAGAAVATSAMTVWRSVGSVGKLLGSSAADQTWIGELGVEKTAAWGDPVPLDLVQQIGKATGTTVNDVCVTLVTGAVGRYLAENGANIREVAWMIPVNLEAFDAELPDTLGNHFSLVLAHLPTSDRGFRDRLAEVHRRIARIRDSFEPMLTFGIQQFVSRSPRSLGAAVTRYFADKAVGVLTNVPGPRAPMSLAGAQVDGVVGWAPCSGRQALTVCVFSYAGKVFFGFGTDRRLIPDPERLVSALGTEVAEAR